MKIYSRISHLAPSFTKSSGCHDNSKVSLFRRVRKWAGQVQCVDIDECAEGGVGLIACINTVADCGFTNVYDPGYMSIPQLKQCASQPSENPSISGRPSSIRSKPPSVSVKPSSPLSEDPSMVFMCKSSRTPFKTPDMHHTVSVKGEITMKGQVSCDSLSNEGYRRITSRY